MSDEARKAHHEAGHAVFATIKGIPYRSVFLRKDYGQGYSGAVDVTEAELRAWIQAAPEPERQIRVDYVVQFKAIGVLAARRYATEAGFSPDIGTDFNDELQLRNLFYEFARDPSGTLLDGQAKLDRSQHLRGKAQQLLEDPIFWRAISTVAQKLQALGELSSAETAEIARE